MGKKRKMTPSKKAAPAKRGKYREGGPLTKNSGNLPVEDDKQQCDKCKKWLKASCNMANHKQRCAFCPNCQLWKTTGGGHFKRCTPELIQAQKDRKSKFVEQPDKSKPKKAQNRPCPLCMIPFRNLLDHLKSSHHQNDDELECYRMYRKRGKTKAEVRENKLAHESQLMKVFDFYFFVKYGEHCKKYLRVHFFSLLQPTIYFECVHLCNITLELYSY